MTSDAQPPRAAKRLGRVHDRILDALARIDGGAPGDRALSEVFRSARDLGSKERATVGDVVYGVLRERRRIDHVLTRAAKSARRSIDLVEPPLMNRLRVLAYLLENGETLEAIAARDKYASKRLPGVMEKIARGKVPPSKLKGIDRLATDLSLPDFVTKHLVDAFGEARTEEIGRALNTRAPVTLRVRGDRDEILERVRADFEVDAQPTKLSPHGIVLAKSIDLFTWAPFKEGLVELQDEGSQLIALAVGASNATKILDACAGAGGKSLAMAASGDARIVALEPDKKKLDVLRERAQRAKADNIVPKKGELETFEEKAKYDRVLVDAPCTGTGTFRRQPDRKWRLEPADVSREVSRQKHLMTSAAAALAPGGILVYATCSVLREENEDVIAHALLHDDRLEKLPLATTWGDEIAAKLGATYEARIGPGPDNSGPDGFYVATMRRR